MDMKKTFTILSLTVILLILAGSRAGSQPVQKYDPSAYWVVYNTANSGMPGNYIHDIKLEYLDRELFATGNGLAVFDGSTWTVYNTSNSNIPSGLLRCLETEDNTIWWVGTVSGLGRFDGTTWTNYFTFNSGLPDPSIDDVTNDPGRDVKWIGTDNGLAKFDDVNWTVYDESNTPLVSDWIRCVTLQGNILWIGTEYGGMARFDGSSGWTIFTTSTSDIPSNTVRSIAVDPATGDIWAGTYYGGIGVFDGSNWTVYNKNNSGLPSNSIRRIAIDGNGTKWLATGAGLVSFDGTTWTVYNTTNSGIPDNVLHCVMIDTADVWVGTDGEGAAVMKDAIVGTGRMTPVTCSVYPNPFSGYVVFEILSSGNETALLSLYDMNGKRVLRNEYPLNVNQSARLVVDGGDLCSGIYGYCLIYGNKTITGKIIRR